MLKYLKITFTSVKIVRWPSAMNKLFVPKLADASLRKLMPLGRG
jgi:hypothetical protein